MCKLLPLVFCACLPACGLLPQPMVPRLSDDQQAQVDQLWVNVVTPPEHADRQTFLDVISVYSLYNAGLDTVRYHAEKRVGDRLITMDVNFDKDRPARDEFIVELYSRDGILLRRERYDRHDVEQSLPQLMSRMPVVSEPKTDEEKKRKAEWEAEVERRKNAVEAATRPAGT